MKEKIIWNKVNHSINKNNDLLMFYRPCPICKKDNEKTVLMLDNFQFFTDSIQPKQVDIIERQCQNCGAIYLNPCYSKEGFGILFKEAGQSYGSTTQRPLEQMEWLRRYDLLRPNSKIMDIGCGRGNFLASLPANVSKIGVDIDEASIDYAQNKHQGIRFVCSAFEEIEIDQSIDVITMYHVLEHLANPLETLQRLFDISDDETKLVVEVPILENGLTNDINGFLSVQHLTHFSRNSFRNILALSGWQVIAWDEQKDYNGCRVLAKKTSNSSTTIHKDYTQKMLLFKYLSNWYKSICRVEEKLQKINTPYCLIWGGGMHLEFIYQISSLFDKNIKFIIVDKDKTKQNKKWRGINICDPSILSDIKNKDFYCIASSYRNQESIKKELTNYGFDERYIITLYDHVNVY